MTKTRLLNPIRLVAFVLLAAASRAEPDFSRVPGVVVAHSPASSGVYLGSPGIAILPDGSYVAKCDEFGPKSTENVRGVTRVYRSADRGQSWGPAAVVHGIYWSDIFVHQGALYMIGVSKQAGDIVVCKSLDGGVTWNDPADQHTGLLRSGRYHTSSMPVLIHDGRLWRTMEVFAPGFKSDWLAHQPLMLSIPLDKDLLEADNWTVSATAHSDPDWLGGKWNTWLEGNPVLTPDGKVADMLRSDYKGPETEKAMLAIVSDDGRSISFDPGSGFIDMPGAAKKFNVLFDPKSKLYWTLANYVPRRDRGHDPAKTRNTSALMCSADLRRWEARCVLLHGDDIAHLGFQYIDFAIDGDDLAAACRTAYDDGLGGAHTQHDANFLTFLRVTRFRDKKPDDSVTPWLAEDLKQYNRGLASK